MPLAPRPAVRNYGGYDFDDQILQRKEGCNNCVTTHCRPCAGTTFDALYLLRFRRFSPCSFLKRPMDDFVLNANSGSSERFRGRIGGIA